MEIIDTIILAGGFGTRLRGVVNNLPKALAPINGRPFLDILLNWLDKCEHRGNVILAVGYMSNKIVEYYGRGAKYNFKIIFSEEKTPLGTGGAIKNALHFVNTESVLVLNGDSFVELNYQDLITYHNEANAMLTLVLKEVENVDRYATVKMNENNEIIFFEEKQHRARSGLVNAGVYVIRKSLFSNVEADTVLSLETDLLPVFIRKVATYGYVTTGKFIDIGVPESYEKSHEYLKEFS